MNKHKTDILEKVAKGWREIEPVIVVNLALKKPIILEGTHGICKSTLGREISRIFGENACRCYDATKDDLVSIASVPIPEELSHGRLVFSKHDRSIWDAKVVYIDELMRANKENQNLWLEILEERTLFGQPLQYEMVIATQNPEGYASNFELDEALLDRFAVVVPIPNLQRASSETIKDVIALNLNKRNGGKSDGIEVEALKNLVAEVRDRFYELIHEPELKDVICTFVSEFMELLLKTENKAVKSGEEQNKIYISPRRWTHITEEIIGMYAYRVSTNGLDDKPSKIKALEESAYWSLYYTLATVLKIDMELLQNVFKKTKTILTTLSLNEVDKLRLDIMKCGTDDDLAELLIRREVDIKKLIPAMEIKMKIATLLNREKKNTLIDAVKICELYNLCLNEAYGVLVETIVSATDSYHWNRPEKYSAEEAAVVDALKQFPPSKEIFKFFAKEE